MIVLASITRDQMREHPHPNLGQLVTPRIMGGVEQTAEDGLPWAADNDAFSGLNIPRYERMLDTIRGLPGCLFVACPDVVGNAHQTDVMFRRWAPGIARRGLPVGYVLQDGLVRPPWDDIAAVFIGGTDRFKGSRECLGAVREAQARGKWVHMGRVNGRRRVVYAKAIGCDSVDGSSWARWRNVWLNQACHWAAAGPQLMLVDDA
jgi:hypothetical protein